MSKLDNQVIKVNPGGKLNGSVRVPGDKSISHRSIMLGSLADGPVHISGFLEGEDALATLGAFVAMGVKIEGPVDSKVLVHGVGLHGLKSADNALDLGNSGTSMRLLSGLLAGQNFASTLTGDQSLSTRPMRRVTDPLTTMGATIRTSSDGFAPIKISGMGNGGARLKAIDYKLPVASAQIKSCLLLAGLYATGKSCVTEPGITRDHTERMLAGFEYPLAVSRHGDETTVCIEGGHSLKAMDIDIPADISSAAFFLVGASIAAGSEITINHVGINPTRTGVIDILRMMGADIEFKNQREAGGEPVADITVRASELKGIRIPESLVPLAIDEFPILFIAAACAKGETLLTGAEELRVKESDRIQVMADGLQKLGINANATKDGMIIQGGELTGGKVDSHGDHRIAMAFAIAGMRASSQIEITDCANVRTSFPNFVSLAASLGMAIEE